MTLKKIVLAGLCEYINYGDQFIAKTVEHIVRSIEPDAKIYFMSFERVTTGLKFKITKKLLEYSKKTICKNWGYRIQYLVIKIRFKKYFMETLKGADGLIFACGSFKFTTQYLWALYSVAVECCEKLNIPIMFDAMDIQKYKQEDWRCKCLKKHANSKCVKMITTRDGEGGVQRLKEYYIDTSRIESYSVGDPAFWIRECYNINKKSGEIIGINLLKADNFICYGGKTMPEEVGKVYAELLRRLEKENYKYELFTNGMPIDRKMAYLIEKELGMEEGTLFVRIPQNDRDLVEIIAGYKAIVGARLHACICAYALDIPMSGFIWAEKLVHFGEMSGTLNLFCSEADFKAEKLFENFELSLNMHYDQENREMWKEKTRDTIASFLKIL